MIAVDIGNSRMKWGRWQPEFLMESLPLDRVDEWNEKRDWWELPRPTVWAVASVNTPALRRFLAWVGSQGDSATIIQDHRDIPLTVDVEKPEGVGIDRLLAALAMKERLAAGEAGVIVDAGTAVTVDFLDKDGVFRGGAIFPGLRLMAESLHEHTAALPLVDGRGIVPPEPGRSTESAIHVGVFWAVVGGIKALTSGYQRSGPARFISTGGSPTLTEALGPAFEYVPGLTLEGIRIAAQERQA